MVRARPDILWLCLCFAFASQALGATSLTGTSGLLYVPTATVVGDSRFAFGGAIGDGQAFPAKSFSHFATPGNEPYFYFTGYLTVGFLPRLEITVRGNGMPGSEGPSGTVESIYTDGMLSMHVLLFEGSGMRPAVAAGLQDVYGFLLFNALYSVVTWRFDTGSGGTFLTAGWAVDWWDKHLGTPDEDSHYRVNHVLVGPFFGLEHPVREWVSVLAEYDTRALNVGARFRPASWVTIDIAAVRWSWQRVKQFDPAGFAAHLHLDGKL